MTATESYIGLGQHLIEGAHASLFLAARTTAGDGIELQQVDIGPHVAAHFIRVARSVWEARDAEIEPWHFQPGEKAGDARMVFLEPAEIPGVDHQVAAVENAGNIPWFEGDEDFKRRLRFYVLRIHQNGETAFFFKQTNQKAELRKKGILVRLAGHRFTEIDDQLFLFEESFDFAVYNGYTYLFTYAPFTNLFKEEIRVAFAERAAPALALLETQLSWTNFDAFAEACQTDHRLSGALVRVMERGGLDHLTTDWILAKNALLHKHQLSVVEVEGGSSHIEFEPAPSKRFILTKILEEKVNQGELSGTTWVAGSHVPG